MNSDNILEIEDLSIDFQTNGLTTRAVEAVNLKLGKGKTLGIVGESGSGKSVTSLAIMGLLPRKNSTIKSGSIWFKHPSKGKINLLEISQEEIQSIRGQYISMIFQEPMTALNPVHKCGKQVMEILSLHEKSAKACARKRVLDLFDEVKLPDPRKAFYAYPHELSGGQRQRVMIAMAMACNPLVLIADEPTTALDVTVQKNILELLDDLSRKHQMAVLFISHDLGVISKVAANVAVMRQGKIVEEGTTKNIFNNPSHPYTKGLIACRPRLDQRPESLPVVTDFLEEKEKELSENKNNTYIRQKEHERIYSKEPILKVEELETFFITDKNWYGKPVKSFKAVDKVSFSVYKGETLGLVGESGCGKTTLGRSIMRLIEPGAGKITYNGVDLSKLSAGELRRFRPKFQIIFQDPYSSLTPGLQVGEAILEPMRIHKILRNDKQRKEKIIELLEKVNLQEHHFYRYPHEFSGGQRQRICIARAIALQPEFVICDESVSALDVSVQAQVLNLLNEMKKEFNLTYIFISHDLSVVKYMSDRIIVMRGGKIIEAAEADELYRQPQNNYTRKLIEAIPEINS